MKNLAVLLLFMLIFSGHLLNSFPFRKYKEGNSFYYKMIGFNNGKEYEAVSHHQVKKQGDTFFEKVNWVSLQFDGKVISLKSMKDFDQILSLDKKHSGSFPDISKIDGKIRNLIVGPIFDLMTFYVDLNPRLFFKKIDELEKGQPILFPYNKPSSWADGHFVILGEDCINFRILFQNDKKRPFLRVEHIAPEKNLNITFPEKWMKNTIGPGENNWVQIRRLNEKYAVSYGYEYFDDHIYIDPETGIILYANMYNPVDFYTRVCGHIEMNKKSITGITECGPISTQHIFRNITIRLYHK